MTNKEMFDEIIAKFGKGWQIFGAEPNWDDEISGLFSVKKVVDKIRVLVYFQHYEDKIQIYKVEIESDEYRANSEKKDEILSGLLMTIDSPDIIKENAKLKAEAQENEKVIVDLRRTAAELRGKFIATRAGQDVLQDTVLKAIAGAK